MKGSNLGELEEIVSRVGVLYDEAYGVAIQDEMVQRCDRKAALSTIHVALHRLEEKDIWNQDLMGQRMIVAEGGNCVTVSFQAIKAGLMNPVNSLRSE